MESCGAIWTHIVSEANLICKLWELCKSISPLSLVSLFAKWVKFCLSHSALWELSGERDVQFMVLDTLKYRVEKIRTTFTAVCFQWNQLYELPPPPPRCHHLEGLSGCLLHSSKHVSTVREHCGTCGKQSCPQSRVESRPGGYFQFPGHLGQMKQLPWTLTSSSKK